MRKVECFKIRLYSSSQFDITSPIHGDVIYEVSCGRKLLSGNPIDIQADPFLFVYGDKLFLFYEDKRQRRKGKISMVYTRDLKTWSTPVTVLEEQFHLSYPFVFEEDGHVYMIPETNEARSIILYEAKDSTLAAFTPEKVLMKDDCISNAETISFCDTSLYKKDGVFYMHTTRCFDGINTLELYVSKSLLGEYKKHPASPIVVDNKYGRNGGCLIEHKNNLYRLAQDCVIRYGDNVHLFRIEELTPTSYKETLVTDNLYKSNNPFYKEGGHQLNMVKFKDKFIVATDAKEYHKFLIPSIINKLLCLLR